MEPRGQQHRPEPPTKEIPEDQDVKPRRVLPFTLFSNGTQKNTTPPPPSPSPQRQRSDAAYGKCMRNHAAALGLHALDGCREFMPSLFSGAGESSTLACAACGCHRNFHRRSPIPPSPAANHGGIQRKRVRTKFSPAQKKRMRELCQRLGWRMQKKDEELVEQCCKELGLSRVVFKVWMHNNKHNSIAGPCSPRAGAPESEEASSCKDASPSAV